MLNCIQSLVCFIRPVFHARKDDTWFQPDNGEQSLEYNDKRGNDGSENDYSVMNTRNSSMREGCFNFWMAWASICLIRSRVTAKHRPTSSRV